MERYLIIYLFSLCLLGSSWASLDDNVVFSNDQNISLGNPWGDQTKLDLYGMYTDDNSFSEFIVRESPFNIIGIIIEDIFSDFSSKATKIAHYCNINNPDKWQKIACISSSVHATLKKYKWQKYSNFCRAHAQAFKEAFKELNIPRSFVGKFEIQDGETLHVLNRMILTDRNGRFFSYLIDVSFNPTVVYPDAILTKEFHDIDRDGITDVFELPEL